VSEEPGLEVFDPRPFSANHAPREPAGYWAARQPVTPKATRAVRAAPQEIVRRGAELRIVESLWPLHDAVSRSTLEFSMIRMRNAQRDPVPSGN
jgi:hypothetical protein